MANDLLKIFARLQTPAWKQRRITVSGIMIWCFGVGHVNIERHQFITKHDLSAKCFPWRRRKMAPSWHDSWHWYLDSIINHQSTRTLLGVSAVPQGNRGSAQKYWSKMDAAWRCSRFLLHWQDADSDDEMMSIKWWWILSMIQQIHVQSQSIFKHTTVSMTFKNNLLLFLLNADDGHDWW